MRTLYQFGLYLLIGGLLALYLDASLQLSTYQQQKEKLCKDLRLAATAFPDVYATCTQKPESILQNLKDSLSQ